MKLKYSKDIYGHNLLENEEGGQIMMEWEKPYMEACIDNLDISGSVLEIGFGLGYSARRICSSPHITEYTVIECAPVVWAKIDEFRKEFPHIKINLIKGRWQDVLCLASTYDRCFFDDYISDSGNCNRFNIFLIDFLKYHTNINCKIGVYSTSKFSNSLSCITTVSNEYEIAIPSHCKYAKGNIMYIICITKISSPIEEELLILKNRTLSTRTVGKLSSNVKFVGVLGTFSNIN